MILIIYLVVPLKMCSNDVDSLFCGGSNASGSLFSCTLQDVMSTNSVDCLFSCTIRDVMYSNCDGCLFCCTVKRGGFRGWEMDDGNSATRTLTIAHRGLVL